MSAQQSPASTPDSMIGRKIGHYTITRRIGQGGMGVVYEAIHDKIKQRVAIKVLHKEMSKDDKVVQRFFNEANAISMAQHSSIVKIIDYGQIEDGTAYIMMEFLEGEPLLTRLERAQEQGTGLGLQMVVEIGRQTAAALALIHEKNIVHRDLKPENIFVVPDSIAPLGERVKLLDFGIAKFLDGPVRKTTVGMILGTPLYMSPEQCEGREDLNAKVDVYALGAMLFEMVAGRLPFQADTAAALMRQHMFKAAPRLHELVPTAPQALDEMISEMLRKEPAERPTMATIAQRLEQLMPEVTGKSSPLVEGVRVPKVARRTGIADTGVPDPLAATLGDSGRISSTSQEQRRSGGSQSRHAGATRSRVPVLVGAIAVLLVGLLLAMFVLPQRTGAQRSGQVATKQPPPSTPITPAPSSPLTTAKPMEPATPPATPATTGAVSAPEKPKAAAEPVDSAEPAKSARKKVGKVAKSAKPGVPEKAPGAAKPAEPAKAPAEDKPAKPSKPGKDSSGSDIGVWRDP